MAWSIGPFAFAYCSSTVPGVLRAVGPPPAPHRVDLWASPPHPWRWKPEKALMTDDDLVRFAEYLPAKVAAVERWPLRAEHLAAGSLA